LGERKIGLVPRVVRGGMGGAMWYGLVVTDRRSIFVLEMADRTSLGAFAFGVVGAALTAGMQSSKAYDYQAADPDVLSGLKDTVTIPHESIESMQFKSGSMSSRILFRYRSSNGKIRKFDVNLVPPDRYVSDRVAAGRGRKDAVTEYANEVRTLFKRALPLTTSMKVEWNQ